VSICNSLSWRAKSRFVCYSGSCAPTNLSAYFSSHKKAAR